MHGLTGGGWKRSVGHGRSERCPGETPGTGAETYRRATSPRQPPTLLRHGVSAATFRYLDLFTWRRVTRWLRKRHPGITWKKLRLRYLSGAPGWRPAEDGIKLFYCQQVEVTRYRWRAANIPTPWASLAAALTAA